MSKIFFRIGFLFICLPLVSNLSTPAPVLAGHEPGKTGITARQAADFVHAVIEAGRRTYSEQIVDRLHKKISFRATENWEKDHSLLLPAQFLLTSSQISNKRGIGMRYRLASLWPVNPRNGPKSENERVGLKSVTSRPGEPFTWVVRTEGRWFFEAIYPDFAVADTCVSCHNHHPKSPRKDFKMGDVMGGIIIDIPLTRHSMENGETLPSLPPEVVADYIHSVLESDRIVYAKYIVDRLERKNILHASENWREEDSLMLPAQFLLNAADIISGINMDLDFRLVSLWPVNPRNGPANEFERIGLEAVEVHPIRPYIGQTRVGGRHYFQAVYPDIAVAPTCVSCHNSHPSSPKRDYKLDDVMGGIVVTMPLN